MEKNARRELTKEVALEAGYRIVKFTTNSEYLHYGRFEPDIPPDYVHLKAAQDRYVERLIGVIPAGVRTILDVGAGSGKTAEVLMSRGYAVDAVSPGKMLAGMVRERITPKGGRVFQARFEDVAIPNRYDLILFSESFQYIPMKIAIEKCLALLNPGGHILICDFFKLKIEPRCHIGGGHPYDRWTELYRSMPLELIGEEDITRETAPLHDITQAANREVFIPLIENGRAMAGARWPILTRIATLLFRRGINKLMQRRMTSDASAAEFIRGKVYKVYVFRRADAPLPAGQ